MHYSFFNIEARKGDQCILLCAININVIMLASFVTIIMLIVFTRLTSITLIASTSHNFHYSRDAKC